MNDILKLQTICTTVHCRQTDSAFAFSVHTQRSHLLLADPLKGYVGPGSPISSAAPGSPPQEGLFMLKDFLKVFNEYFNDTHVKVVERRLKLKLTLCSTHHGCSFSVTGICVIVCYFLVNIAS